MKNLPSIVIAGALAMTATALLGAQVQPAAPAVATTTATSTTDNSAAQAQAGPNGATTAARPSRQAAASDFETRILAGGASNALDLDVQAADLPRLPAITLQWRPASTAWQCEPVSSRPLPEVLAKAPKEGNESRTVLTLFIPSPPCWWPFYQYAHITVIGDTFDTGGVQQARSLYEGTVRVSVLWFPLLVTFAVVGFIYPGCSMIAWRAERRRANRELSGKTFMDVLTTPSLWKKLDPVQITANMWGRASLPKLQIFGFSLIIFGLLLYFQIRNGILSGLSSDVVLLLGISGVGTAAARYTYSAKRRISLESWAWLRSNQWLPNEDDEKKGADVASRATWSELITDADSKEFDIYSFQMAIFSVVVAAALLSTSLTGLATFEIPSQLLGLLGLSQAIFIGGKASEDSPFAELDKKLASVRDHEKRYQEAVAKTATSPGDKDAQAQVATEREAFKTEVVQAATMFWSLYAGVLKPKPAALAKVDKLEPALSASASF